MHGRLIHRKQPCRSSRNLKEVPMRARRRLFVIYVLMCFFSLHLFVAPAVAQEGEQPDAPGRTMRPIIRGRHYAVVAMKAEATRAAERILEAGRDCLFVVVAAR